MGLGLVNIYKLKNNLSEYISDGIDDYKSMRYRFIKRFIGGNLYGIYIQKIDRK